MAALLWSQRPCAHTLVPQTSAGTSCAPQLPGLVGAAPPLLLLRRQQSQASRAAPVARRQFFVHSSAVLSRQLLSITCNEVAVAAAPAAAGFPTLGGDVEALELQGSSSAAVREDGIEQLTGLPLPKESHQPQLDYKDIKVLRTASNTAAKDKTLVYIQVGQQGITQSFLAACMDILIKHQHVRVRLGEGCGLDRKEAAQAMERLLDCLCVHQIGHTITLYRQQGLPRPSNCQPSGSIPVAAAPTRGSEAAPVKAARRPPAAGAQQQRQHTRPTRQVPSRPAGTPEFVVL